MGAVGNGYSDCAALLLSEGADVLAVDINQRSALHRAVSVIEPKCHYVTLCNFNKFKSLPLFLPLSQAANGHDECVESLLHKEADVLCRYMLLAVMIVSHFPDNELIVIFHFAKYYESESCHWSYEIHV
jgi:hypothetical protein